MESVEARLAAFRPRTGTMEAWNAAYVRTEDYLRAHRIHNRLHQSRLIQTVLERAALVRKERRGREQLVHAEPGALHRVARLLDAYEQLWRHRARAIDAILAEGHEDREGT